MDEQLYISMPRHRLAKRESVTFADLAGESFLMQAHVSFWMDVCRRHLPNTNLLVQSSVDALGELVEGTDFPAFSSDHMIESGRTKAKRISIPILDDDAHVTCFRACRNEEKKKYAPFC